MTALSDLLTSVNDGRYSARALARMANERGFSLNHDTAARYLRGDHGRPDEATLLAFADILEVPLAQLRTAAGLPSEMTEPYVPPPEASRLSRRQRLAVDEVIRAMLDPGRATTPAIDTDMAPAEQERTRTAGTEAHQTTRLRAARHGEPEPPGD